MHGDEIGWFDFDPDLDREQQPTEAQAAFLAVLRRRAEAWAPRREPDDTEACYPWRKPTDLLVTLDINSTEGNHGLLRAAVRFDGAAIRCDERHPQDELPEPRTPLAMDASGTPAELAALAADWFDWLLRRPAELHEWLHEDGVYAWTYLITDPEHELYQCYDPRKAPPGRHYFPDRPPDRVSQLSPSTSSASPPPARC